MSATGYAQTPTGTIAHVKPKTGAKAIAFYSFGPALFGGAYYEAQDLYNAMKADCLLDLEMNGQPLLPVYGAPADACVSRTGMPTLGPHEDRYFCRGSQ